MRPGQRFGFSAIEKREVWSRWKAGQSLHEIGRALTSHVAVSLGVVASRRHPSRRSSPFAAGAHASGARGHLTRNRFRFAASEMARRLDQRPPR